jgi:putative membrane protein
LVTRLTAEEKTRIHAAIADAESRTHLHVAVSVVPASDHYLLYPIAFSAVAALLIGGALAIGRPHVPLREAFAVEAIAFVVLSILFEWWPLRLKLVPRKIRRHRAQVLAHREFAARILASSERRGGVLFFVSLGERYVQILADRQTHARMGVATWERIVADYIATAKHKPVADAVIQAVQACAAVLQLPSGDQLTNH